MRQQEVTPHNTAVHETTRRNLSHYCYTHVKRTLLQCNNTQVNSKHQLTIHLILTLQEIPHKTLIHKSTKTDISQHSYTKLNEKTASHNTDTHESAKKKFITSCNIVEMQGSDMYISHLTTQLYKYM